LLESRWYPGVFQYPLLALFLIALGFAFFGTIRPGRNFATVSFWGLWWPLLPLTYLLFGRLWCGVCPIAKAGDFVHRFVRPRRPGPGPWLKASGVWIMSLLFLLVTWADRVWNITGSPGATGLLLLAILLGAVFFSLLYQRRVWCRYLCPLGALSGIYATTAVVELRADPEACLTRCKTKDCYVGNHKAPGCPLFEFPQTMESNRNCNLCGNCIKTCPHEAIQLRLRPPGQELGRLGHPLAGESFLAVIMVALVFVQTFSMTSAYPRFMKWSMEGLGIMNYNLMFSLAFAGLVVAGLGLYGATAWASGWLAKEPFRRHFALFGYALIALALAGHLGHNFFHLAVEGKAALQTSLGQLGFPWTIFTIVEKSGTEFHPASTLVKVSMIATLALGLLGTGVVLWRIAQAGVQERGQFWRRFLPHAILVTVLAGLFLYVFLIPMNLRHLH
jgi:polyferredoxin